MPYCPKCDMEFVEGVEVCSDCGGPLLASPEEAKALQKEALENARKEQFVHLEDEGLLKEAVPEEASVKRQERLPSSVYVKKSERYLDMKSSALAFLLIGCVSILLSALIFAKIIPITASSQTSFGVVLGVMGIVCLVICIKTKKEAAGLKEEAEKENQETKELISWFLQTHSAEELDKKLAEEQENDSPYTPEELSLKRFSLIQDYLAIEKDLPDQTYIDALSEEIYSQMFEQS